MESKKDNNNKKRKLSPEDNNNGGKNNDSNVVKKIKSTNIYFPNFYQNVEQNNSTVTKGRTQFNNINNIDLWEKKERDIGLINGFELFYTMLKDNDIKDKEENVINSVDDKKEEIKFMKIEIDSMIENRENYCCPLFNNLLERHFSHIAVELYFEFFNGLSSNSGVYNEKILDKKKSYFKNILEKIFFDHVPNFKKCLHSKYLQFKSHTNFKKEIHFLVEKGNFLSCQRSPIACINHVDGLCEQQVQLQVTFLKDGNLFEYSTAEYILNILTILKEELDKISVEKENDDNDEKENFQYIKSIFDLFIGTLQFYIGFSKKIISLFDVDLEKSFFKKKLLQMFSKYELDLQQGSIGTTKLHNYSYFYLQKFTKNEFKISKYFWELPFLNEQIILLLIYDNTFEKLNCNIISSIKDILIL